VSIHEQIWFPHIVDGSDKMPDEHHMVWPNGLPEKLQMSLTRSPVPFSVVARHACADEVFPRIGPPARTRDDVVDCQRFPRIPAVLTSVVVATQDILSRKDNLLIGHGYVDRKADDAGKRHCRRNRPEYFSFV